MKENLTGKTFASHIVQGKFARILVELSQPVNTDILSEAFARALADCPFFDQTLVMKDGSFFFAPHKTDRRIRTLQEEKTIAGGFGSDLVYVAAEGRTISIGVSHAMTDGFGIHALAQLLFYHYFCLLDNGDYPKPKIYSADGRVVLDEETDLLGDFVDVGKTGEGENDGDQNHDSDSSGEQEAKKDGSGVELTPVLQLPDVEEAGSAAFAVSIRAAQFKNGMRELFTLSEDAFHTCNRQLASMGGLSAVFTAILMAQAIQKIHPENALAVGCRFPVNVRAIFGAENAVRNFSMPQAVLTMSPGALSENGSSAFAVKEVLSRLLPQLTKEGVYAQLSELRALIEKRKQGASSAMAYMFGQTFLVSNVGRVAYEPEAGRVSFAGGIYPGFPLMLYLSSLADRQLLTITQTFSSERYVNGLLDAFRETGILDCHRVEVKGID